jgi:transcriptional regulator with XRE-family HTH domain
MLSLKSKEELFRELIERCRAVRLRQNFTQAEVAARAGIPLSTYRRFEQEGQLSVERFVAVLHAVNQVESLEKFLQPPPVSDLRQLYQPAKTRQRARLRSCK